jgi:hypothetical protein
MGIRRTTTWSLARVEPVLCCMICGAEVPPYQLDEILQEREDWRKIARRRGQFASVTVPAEELEQTGFVKHPSGWSFFFRASQSPLR